MEKIERLDFQPNRRSFFQVLQTGATRPQKSAASTTKWQCLDLLSNFQAQIFVSPKIEVVIARQIDSIVLRNRSQGAGAIFFSINCSFCSVREAKSCQPAPALELGADGLFLVSCWDIGSVLVLA